MATVYRANHTELDRAVALKVLKTSQLQTVEQQMRFRNEAQLISSLSHPNIVSIYSTGISETGIPYIVMELLDGRALSDIIKSDGPLNYRQAVPLFMQTCSALEHAHSKGIIHRDIKPSNLVVMGAGDPSPQVKVVDFGIAKALEGDSLTQTNVIVGSVFYLSPGQCEGRSADTQSDIYALGCSMFETITGRPPFVSDFYLETLQKHRDDDPPRIQDIRPGCDVPPSLEAVIDCCLQKDKSRRYQSIADLRIDLENVLNGRSPERIPASTGPVAAKSKTRRSSKVSPVTIFGIAALLACLSIAIFYLYPRLESSRDESFIDWEGERSEIRRLILLCHKPGQQIPMASSEKLLTEAIDRSIRIDDPALQTRAATELICVLSNSSQSMPPSQYQEKMTRFIGYSEAATTKLRAYLKQGKIKQASQANDLLLAALLVQGKDYPVDSPKVQEILAAAIEAYHKGTKEGQYRDMAVSGLNGLIRYHIFKRENAAAVARARERIAIMREDRHHSKAEMNRLIEQNLQDARTSSNNEVNDQLQSLLQK